MPGLEIRAHGPHPEPVMTVYDSETHPARAPFARWLDGTNEVIQTFLAAGQIQGLINLAGGLPEPSTWPVDELAELARRAVADSPGDALAYPPVDGLPDLRDVIARRFSEGPLHLTRENVLITSGGTQALDVIGKALLDPGAVVAAQTPAYLGALDAWRPRAPRYRPMRLQDADCAPQTLMDGAAFAYTVPNFSNPTGRLVPEDQRHQLVAAAEATGCWLVEDDPYGVLHYDGPPLPRMLTLSAQGDGPYRGPVIYLGTLSKELAPGLRIGWVIAAPEMIRALATAKLGSDMCSSGLTQVIARDALESGLVDRCLPVILATYRERRDALLTAMTTHLDGDFTWERPTGGMFVWARARDPRLNTDALLDEGLRHGVCISPSSVFDPEGHDHGAIRINFTLNPADRLEEGIRRLAAAVASLKARAQEPAQS